MTYAKIYTHMKLTDAAIKNAKPKKTQYRLPDGGGLCLLILPKGAKYWQLRYRYNEKGKLLALGVYPEVKLAVAREKAREAKATLAAGDDPSAVKKQAKLTKQIVLANTFAAVAAEWFELKSPDWSATHKARTSNILKNNLGRWIGSRPISEITAPELLAALRNTEKKGTLETAKRSLQVAGQVFRYAVATGKAERVPSENLKGTLAAPKVKHFSAITNPVELGNLLVAMDGYTGSPEVKAALQLSALLFQRPGEIRHMQWSDIDFDVADWRYVATKTQTPHVVPLASQSLSILRSLQLFTGRGRYVFPSGRARGRAMSENAVRAALRTLGYSNDQQTPHGFRATARTILDEVLGYRVDWIEHQLAHAVKDANGRAYNRTAHLEGRKAMMQGWADYLDQLRAEAGGKSSNASPTMPKPANTQVVVDKPQVGVMVQENAVMVDLSAISVDPDEPVSGSIAWLAAENKKSFDQAAKAKIIKATVIEKPKNEGSRQTIDLGATLAEIHKDVFEIRKEKPIPKAKIEEPEDSGTGEKQTPLADRIADAFGKKDQC